MHRRASTTARGYGAGHQRLREQLLAFARAHPDSDAAHCWRCSRALSGLDAGDIHLGHDDDDRTQYRGLECATCNLRAAAERTNSGRRGHTATRHDDYPERGVLVVDVDDI